VSISVPLPELAARIGEYGSLAFLVTVGDDFSAHVVSVRVAVAPDGGLRSGASRRSRANLGARPAATLLWPPGPDGRYSLIADVTAPAGVEPEGPVTLTAHSAVLHVLAAEPA